MPMCSSTPEPLPSVECCPDERLCGQFAPLCEATRTPLPSIPDKLCCPAGSICAAILPPCLDSTSRPSLSAKPTRKPEIELPSAPPTPRPDFVVPSRTPFPSRRPVASRMFIPDRELVPSRLPKPSGAAPSPRPDAERPLIILTKIKFPDANITEFKKPEKMQQIQASLACVLRQPLENILIRNITRMFADGRIEPVEFDAAAAALSSNGAIVCLTKNAGPAPAPARLLRNLQEVTSTTSVDYAVLNPSNDLLSLDQTTFASVVSNSQELNNLASAVGSSGVTAVVPAEIAVSAAQPISAPAGASPAAGAAAASNSMNVGGMAGGIVGGVLCAAAIGIAVLTIRSQRRKRAATLARPSSSMITRTPVVIVTPNPVNDMSGATAYRSQRVVGFNPQYTRTTGSQV